MICPDAMLDGLLLAAAARPASSSGANPRAETGLAPGLARVVRDRVQEFEALPTAERHLALGQAARQLMPAISGEALPARARALLATEVERELGG
ncbi:MAG: hypothetical protein GXP55_12105, partial [Deltaproteobacteria bacterium]|nr:hypothetical protein [Deltaproteobacteria bacterium]